MARQAQVEETVPTTLPDDFDFWDGGEALPATLPKDFDNFDEAQAPGNRSSAPRAAVAAPALSKVAETPVDQMPAPAHAAPPAPKRTREVPIVRRPAATPAAQPAKYVTTEELSALVQEYDATLDEESDGEKQRKKKLMIRWIGGIVLVLAILAAVVFLMLQKPAERNPGVVVVRNPTVTYTPDATPFKEKPSPAKPTQPATEKSGPAPRP
jgi:hypothetical protein